MDAKTRTVLGKLGQLATLFLVPNVSILYASSFHLKTNKKAEPTLYRRQETLLYSLMCPKPSTSPNPSPSRARKVSGLRGQGVGVPVSEEVLARGGPAG